MPSTRKAVSFRLPAELLAAVDRARGDVSRTRFVERALEKALGSTPPRSPVVADAESRAGSPDPVVRPPASSRAPQPPEPEVDPPPLPKIAKRHWA